jgi:acetyl esterase/lipase
MVQDQPRRPTRDPLLFPRDASTVRTMKVVDSKGEREVVYRSYRHLPYVARPVDAEYQSLDVLVPTAVDGVAVDATDAPILLANSIGGFMSSSNARDDAHKPGGEGTVGGRHADLALAAGYVVVWPGTRGRDNQAPDGTYYGKAPAAIVDLKAAVCYVRHNEGVMPGNVEHIVSTGCSAGGGLSALLGASGDSPLYEPYLREIGAADAHDRIYAAGCYSPIIDLDHGDMAYEWMYGPTPRNSSGEQVDQGLSAELKALFTGYQASLGLRGRDGFGLLTALNYDEYLLRYYLVPSATEYLAALEERDRSQYLAVNEWIAWKEGRAVFSFADYVAHAGRFKGIPAFDDFELELPEPSLFGDRVTEARHFTDFTLQKTTGDTNARVDPEVRALVDLMNPMYFILRDNPGCAHHWWLRRGTGETGVSQTAIVNLAASLENRGKHVDARFFWDAAHCIDRDAEGFVKWIGEITARPQ